MPKWLSQEWLDESKKLAQSQPERPGASSRMQYVVTGAPDGDIKYYWVLENGKLPESNLAVLAAGCGAPKGAGSAASTTSSTTTTVKGPVDAVALRARLTGLLQGSVYLTGFATGAVLNGTDPGPATTALETNSTRLQDTLTGVIGPALGAQFGTLWRQHIALFVTYARAKAAAAQAGTAKTVADLDQVRANAAELLDRATHGQLAKEAMSDERKPHVGS